MVTTYCHSRDVIWAVPTSEQNSKTLKAADTLVGDDKQEN